MGRKNRNARNRGLSKSTNKPKTYTTINRPKTGQVVNNEIVGYCSHNRHPGLMYANMLKEHDCIQKNCPYLRKYEGSPYWIKRRLINVLKKFNANDGEGFISIEGVLYKTNNIDRLYAKAKEKTVSVLFAPNIKYIHSLKEDEEQKNRLKSRTEKNIDYLSKWGLKR